VLLLHIKIYYSSKMDVILQTQAVKRRRASRRLVALYDADCGFCTATARWLAHRDHERRLTFLPLQAASGSSRPQVRVVARTHDLASALHVLDEASGRVDVGGGAILALLGVLPRWRTIARLAAVGPGPRVVDGAYRLIADHRHRVGRLLRLGGATCQLAHGADGLASGGRP